jgi:hypothetical protein
MATATENPRVITEAEFHASREYRALTERQRKWVEIVVTTQDPDRATREAFGATAEAYVKMLTGKLETSPRVRAALHFYFGRTEREAFLEDVKTDLRRSKPGSIARTKFAALYAKLTFGVDPESEAEGTNTPDKFAIGEKFKQNGQTYQVVAEEVV